LDELTTVKVLFVWQELLSIEANLLFGGLYEPF
jgi:hypothetical protein